MFDVICVEVEMYVCFVGGYGVFVGGIEMFGGVVVVCVVDCGVGEDGVFFVVVGVEGDLVGDVIGEIVFGLQGVEYIVGV